MIKTIPCCDFCGKEMTWQEHAIQFDLGFSALKEWDVSRQFLVCKDCASKIDQELVKVKLQAMEGKP